MRVPRYDRSVSVPANAGGAAMKIDPAIAAAGDAAVVKAGQALVELGEAQAKAAETERYIAGQTELRRNIRELRDQVEQDEPWTSLADSFEERAKAAADGIGSKLSDPTLRARFNLVAEELIGANRAQLRAAAAKRQAAEFVTSLDSGLDELARDLAGAADPRLRDVLGRRAHEMIRMGIDAGLIDQARGEKAARDFMVRADFNDANRLIFDDPRAAQEALADRTRWDRLPDEDRLRLQEKARAQVEKLEREAEQAARERLTALRADVKRRFDDAIADIRYNGDSGLVSEGEIRAAYPNDAPRMIAALRDEKEFHRARQTVALNGPEEDAALLETQRPRGENAEAEARRFEQLARAIEHKRRALADDPAAYALQASPQLRAAFEAARADPQRHPEAFALLDTTQAALGVPAHRRRLLSDAEAEDRVMRLQAAGAENAADAVQAQAAVYGAYWPRVYGELVRHGKLPAEYRVLATVADPIGRQKLAEALKQGRDSLRQGLDATAAKDIDAVVREELAPLRRSLALGSDGGGIANDYERAAQMLAYRYAAIMEPAAAARAAAGVVALDRYDFVDDGRAIARAPKGQLAAAEAEAARIMAELTADELQRPRMGSTPLTDAQLATVALSAARQGLWITNPNDDGWILLDANRQPVLRMDGSVVGFRFADIGPAPPEGGLGIVAP